jgi:hypothetical protein
MKGNLLNPYDISSINNPKVYQIDPVNFDLYLLSHLSCEPNGSTYDDNTMIRSLLLGADSLSKNLSIELYSEVDSDKIYYPVSSRPNQYIILSFTFQETGEKQMKQTLSKLKENRESIKNWIKINHQLLELENGSILLDGFPKYDIPSLPATIKETDVSLISVSLNQVEIVTNNKGVMINDEVFNFKFQISTSIYCLEIESPKETNNSSLIFKIRFKDKQELMSWKVFMKAMNIRKLKK